MYVYTYIHTNGMYTLRHAGILSSAVSLASVRLAVTPRSETLGLGLRLGFRLGAMVAVWPSPNQDTLCCVRSPYLEAPMQFFFGFDLVSYLGF